MPASTLFFRAASQRFRRQPDGVALAMRSKYSWRTWAWAFLPGLLLTLAYLFCATVLGWRLNTTASLPMGIWKIKGDFHRGSVVSACLPLTAPTVQSAKEWGYFHDGECQGGIAPLMKEVLALPGDTVELTAGHFSVNGQVIPNTATVYQDLLGRQIHPIARGRYTVLPGTYWLIANINRASYDSRYFGPVPADHIIHVMKPVLLLPDWKFPRWMRP